MSYARKLFGYYLMCIMNYLVLMEFHQLAIVRIVTAAGFIVLGMYREKIWRENKLAGRGQSGD